MKITLERVLKIVGRLIVVAPTIIGALAPVFATRRRPIPVDPKVEPVRKANQIE